MSFDDLVSAPDEVVTDAETTTAEDVVISPSLSNFTFTFFAVFLAVVLLFSLFKGGSKF